MGNRFTTYAQTLTTLLSGCRVQPNESPGIATHAPASGRRSTRSDELEAP